MNAISVNDVSRRLAAADPSDLPALLDALSADPRPGVIGAVARARRRLERDLAEASRLDALAVRERALCASGMIIVAGVDEVGRGALAGPVTAGACVFRPDAMLPGLDDSKRLTPHARETLHVLIDAQAEAWAVGHAEPAEIDALGIAGATVLAMRRALGALGASVEHVLVDGRPVDLGLPSTAVVRGDSSVRAIAAASIVAKVTRDALMVALDAEYPGYGLAGNKGYGSPDHLEALVRLGPSPIHRMSFGPCGQPSLF